MPHEEKLNVEFEEKKFSLSITESWVFKPEMSKTSLFSNKLIFFPQVQILIFLHEATQNDHIRLLYRFENSQKKLVLLEVVDMRQLLLNERPLFKSCNYLRTSIEELMVIITLGETNIIFP